MQSFLEKSNVQDIVELNMAQKGMLFHYLKETAENLYNVQMSFRLEGEVREDLLRQAILTVQSRNEALRSVFNWEKTGKPLQIILKECPLDLQFQDLSGMEEEDITGYVRNYSAKDRNDRFDLQKLPVRIRLIRTAANTCIFIITNHHILYDGWSSAILMQEIFTCYRQLKDGREGYPDGKPSFKEVRQGIQKNLDPAANTLFWESYLKGAEITPIIRAFHKGEGGDARVHKLSFTFPPGKIERFVREYKVTPAAILYSAFGLLLSKYGDRSDVLLGTTVSGRDIAVRGIDKVMGNFITTLPLRITGIGEKALRDIVTGVNRDLITRSGSTHLSYFEIRQLADTGSDAPDDLFDSLVVIENYPVDEEMINSNNEFRVALESAYENPDIPLVISIFSKTEMEIELVYKTRDLSTGAAGMIGQHFIAILATLLDHPELTSFSLLPGGEETAAGQEYNDTEVSLPEGATVLSMFDQQVERVPGHVAQRCQGQVSTYAGLQKRSRSIAGYLAAVSGIRPGDAVGIMLEREDFLIPSILGILEAGGAFLPIDPAYPPERINAILQDSGINVLITRGRYIHPTLQAPSGLLDLDKDAQAMEAHAPFSAPVKQNGLAYIIYTSGSTGKPKGVMIEHGSLLNYISWAADTYVRGEPVVFPLYSSISFDLTITSIFLPLVTGNTILVYGDGGQLALIEQVVADNQVHIIKLTPSHLKILRDSNLPKPAGDNKIKRLIVGGEDLDRHLTKEIYDRFEGRIEIFNEYGPTEATVGCMIHLFNPDEPYPSVPIGKPIYNSRVYLLDKQLMPVPAGVPGELYIAGKGLARGYLFNEGLTAEKFVQHAGIGRMYRTGDLAVRMPDGKMLFRGRGDDQIKIRGHRIEPGEIEEAIKKYKEGGQPPSPDITDVIVLAREDPSGNKFMTAYFVSGSPIDKEMLRMHLKTHLPEYMIPAYFMQLSGLPLTPNGKIDRKSLPEPTAERVQVYEAPSTRKEKLLADAWSGVLGIGHISVTDNFFALGGDSIKSIRISSKIRSAGYDLSVKQILAGQTIRNLATQLKDLIAIADQSPVRGEADLSAIQQWFFDKARTDQHHFNQSVLLHFREGIPEERVRGIFGKLQQHHDALRLVFTREGENIKQRSLPPDLALSLVVADLRGEEDPESTLLPLAHDIQSGIDLRQGPLMRLGLFHLPHGSRLLIVIHHLVVDGVSWRILLEDIATLYRQSLQNEPLSLPLK
ncbi:MAG TPA: amino acid adenylation domain-containing protein, partial [Puia sp.]|nr:amino acid adenylation domain-containing protein [Puia sp.]